MFLFECYWISALILVSALKLLTDDLTRKLPPSPLSILKLKGAFLILSSRYIYMCIIYVLTELGLWAVVRAVQ